jgi:NAD(P)-dependent dehydrogenase (short-subunit alcohol dehydrogenase family)
LDFKKEIDHILGKWSPLNRPGYPADIAGIVALIASEEAQWITGQTIQASGGAQMS